MKIKNLNIKKTLKTTAAALVTGTFVLTSSIGVMPTKVEASSYTYTNNVMYYFTSNVNSDVEKYLDKDESSTNLNKLLGYYDTLYDFINYSTYVQNTYYKNLTYAEQEELNYLLTLWGNQIYDMYHSKSYFSTNCKTKLGFTLKYNSQETGYDSDHEKTMEYYTDTLDEKLDTYLEKTNSQTNLKSALDVYKNLVNFVKGSTRSYGYIFSELTQTEQQDITMLLENWTYDLMNEYNGYSYYSSSCVSKVGWTVNIDNLYQELGQNIYQSTNINQYPNYSINQYPNYNTNQSPVVTNPVITTPTNPVVSIPTTTPAVTMPQNSINNTIGKDWRANYIDPSINTSRGVSDYVPEDLNDLGNNWNYNQNTYGYYDQYGNFIPYNNYNQYNGDNGYNYQDGYVADYVPKYIP